MRAVLAVNIGQHFHITKRLSTSWTVRNSLSGSLEPLVVAGDRLTWYSCGPTVYEQAHLGHARCYVCTDIIRRILTDFLGVSVTFAIGITDIDDKIIDRVREQRQAQQQRTAITVEELRAFTHGLERDFFSDMAALGVREPDAVLRVTEHVDDIVAYIAQIIRNGLAYEAADGVYFDVGRVADYGKLANSVPPPEHMLTAESSSSSCKRGSRDFALWKAARPDSGEPSWPSPWGAGRPGWHIECSAMTHAHFGSALDLHSGGVDLKFPHHNNEIAQSEAHSAQEGWVRYWLHTGHLYIENRKMSKSLKNFISIGEFLRGGYSSRPEDDFRIFCLQHHYSSSVHFSADRIVEAAAFRARVESLVARVRSLGVAERSAARSRATRESRRLADSLLACEAEVAAALRSDFNTPRALQSIAELVAEAHKYLQLASDVGRDAGGTASALAHPVEPALAAAGFSCRVLGRLGVGAFEERRANEAAASALDVLVAFRSCVRSAALAGVKAGGPAAGSLKEVLRECDEARSCLRQMGVLVDDIAPDKSVRKNM